MVILNLVKEDHKFGFKQKCQFEQQREREKKERERVKVNCPFV